MLGDVRHCFRLFAKSPGFTFVAFFTLALGIGVNSAMFSAVYGVLLRPLPYHDPGRLVVVWSTSPSEPRSSFSAGDFLDYQRDNQVLDGLTGYRGAAYALTEGGTQPVWLGGLEVTGNFFDVMGVPAERGRAFSARTDHPQGEHLAVLSHASWQRVFGSDPSAVNRRVRLNGEPYTIVGVMPPDFAWPGPPEIWVMSPKPVPSSPLAIEGDLLTSRDVRYFQATARLKAGVSIAQAEASLRVIAARLEREHPRENASRSVRLVRLHDQVVGDVRSMLWLLLATVSFVLLIACANVANLLLARATGRQREIAVRAALGASRGRLVRQLLTESLVLGSLGGGGGLLAGAWTVDLLSRLIPSSVPRVDEIRLDAPVVLWTLGISIVTSLLFGAAPAFVASRADLAGELKAGTVAGGPRRARLRAVFVVAEIALTFVLLAGAGLLVNSFLRLQRVHLGFRTDKVTVVELPIPQERYPTTAQQSQLYGRLVNELAARPGVEAAAVGFPTPLQASNASGDFDVEGGPSRDDASRPRTTVSLVSPDFFHVLGIPLLRGRPFTERDTEQAPRVAILNETLARRYWPGRDPIGTRLRFGPGEPWLTVVGIVGTTRGQGLAEPPPNILYVPYGQLSLPFLTLYVRSAANHTAVLTMLRAAAANVDPSLPLGDARSMDEVISRSVAEPRFRTLLILAFAGVALVLAAVGVYGLISFAVTQRLREIGIRVALGANRRQVLGPLVSHGLSLASIGLALGLAGAIATTRALSTFLFGVSATDPLTYGAVAATLLAITLLATYVPARRALKVDPVTVLRAE
jgi:putative ABC transport system permease protein